MRKNALQKSRIALYDVFVPSSLTNQKTEIYFFEYIINKNVKSYLNSIKGTITQISNPLILNMVAMVTPSIHFFFLLFFYQCSPWYGIGYFFERSPCSLSFHFHHDYGTFPNLSYIKLVLILDSLVYLSLQVPAAFLRAKNTSTTLIQTIREIVTWIKRK